MEFCRVLDYSKFMKCLRFVVKRNGCKLAGGNLENLSVKCVTGDYAVCLQNFLEDWKVTCPFPYLKNSFTKVGYNRLWFNTYDLCFYDVVMNGEDWVYAPIYVQSDSGRYLSHGEVIKDLQNLFMFVVSKHGFSDDVDRHPLRNMQTKVMSKGIGYVILCGSSEVAKDFAIAWGNCVQGKYKYLSRTMLSPKGSKCFGYVGVHPSVSK